MTLSDLGGHSSIERLLNAIFRTVMRQLTRFRLTLHVARSVCDS